MTPNQAWEGALFEGRTRLVPSPDAALLDLHLSIQIPVCERWFRRFPMTWPDVAKYTVYRPTAAGGPYDALAVLLESHYVDPSANRNGSNLTTW